MRCMLDIVPLPHGLELRAAKPSDRAFMQQLFNATRENLRGLPLPAPQIEVLLEQQYRLQQAYYARQWPNAGTFIIQLSGKAVGKIMLDQSETALHIVDLALEPDIRGRGYGTAIVRSLQKAAQKSALAIGLSVDRQNLQAERLYRRLGFTVTGIGETHESMNWSPSAPVASGDVSGGATMTFSRR